MRASRDAGGQMIVLFAVFLVPLSIVMALVLDGGYAWVQRRTSQNAADFAALAAARIILQNAQGAARTDGDVATAMWTVAAANGATIPDLGTPTGPRYTDANGTPLSPPVYVGTTLSTASIPPAARGVTVSAWTAWQPLVSRVLGLDLMEASAEATARFSLGGASPCALCILNGVAATSNSVTLTVNGGSVLIKGSTSGSNSVRVTTNNGSILVDGSLSVANSSTFTATNGSIHVTGDLAATGSSRFTASQAVATNGNLSLSNSSRVSGASVNVEGTVTVRTGSTVSPTPTRTGAVTVTVTDPLAWLSQPTNPNPAATPQGYTCQGSQTCTFNPGIGTLATVTVDNSSTATLYPGIYNRITVGNSSTARLQPGTYYVAGASGSVSVDNSSKIVGLGAVTLVFLDQASLSVANSAGLQISAPSASLSPTTTYPWPGVAIYSARGNTATISLANSSSYPVVGAIYARDGTLTTANSSSVGVQALIVVGSYLGANSSSLTTTYSTAQNPTLPGGSPQLVK